MWVRSSNILLQPSDSKHTPFLFGDQWLQSASVRYLPDTMTACTVAIETFAGEEPAVVQSGWGVVNDINAGLKIASDGNAAASDRSTDSQWSMTRFFTIDLKPGFVGGVVSRSRGLGRAYRTHNFVIWWNQDLGDFVLSENTLCACSWRTLSFNR